MADQRCVDGVVGVQASTALGADHDVAVAARVEGFAAQVGFERLLIDQDVDGRAGPLRAGRRGGSGAGHGNEGVRASLRLCACKVGGRGVVAQASSGIGPVGLPLGFEEPGEDLVELDTGEFGEIARQSPAPVGTGPDLETPIGVSTFVPRSIAVGIGERLPGSRPTLELVERLLDGIVEERGSIAFEHGGLDAGVGGDASHQLALANTDDAVGLGDGPVGQRVVEAGGLHSAVCVRT